MKNYDIEHSNNLLMNKIKNILSKGKLYNSSRK